MFLFLENTLNLGIFSDASLSTQNSPMLLSLPPPPLYTPGTGKLLVPHPTPSLPPRQVFFENMFSPTIKRSGESYDLLYQN